MPGNPEPEPGIELVIVAAIAENGVIGNGGEMPWHYPEDLRRFKETTMGHPVVMGRRTFESILDRLGEPLPGRTNVVLTTNPSLLPDGVVAAESVGAAIDAAAETGAETAYVVGGASVYEQFLSRADRLAITEIQAEYEGDTYFPTVDWTEWREIERHETDDLAFVEYERRDGE
ncbi:MAG: dihydrofolate reductase [Halobacteriales archaeon]|jgi:dihydrofolate reductase